MEKSNIELVKSLTARKFIHLGSLIFPAIYYFIEKDTMLAFVFVLCFISLAIDSFRQISPFLKKIFAKYFQFMLKPKEMGTKFCLTGASYLLIGICLLVSFFPKNLAIISLTIVLVADTFAGFFGRIYGKKKLYKNKSYLGLFCFWISGFITCIIVLKILNLWQYNEILYITIISIFFTGIFELFIDKFRLDDNLGLPVFFAATYSFFDLLI